MVLIQPGLREGLIPDLQVQPHVDDIGTRGGEVELRPASVPATLSGTASVNTSEKLPDGG